MAMAKLLESRSHIMPGKMKVTELFFSVPLDYSKPDGPTIRLFARQAEKVEKPAAPETEQELKNLPYFIYLAGGPGSGCNEPQQYGVVPLILDKGYQVLFPDQRGAGLSSTISANTLAQQGSAEKQAAYLKHFRADNIVKDCEAIRKTLTKDFPEDKKEWSVMGQSFGGFCITNYLSQAPEGLREVFIAGGLPPLVKEPYQLYKKLLQRVKGRSNDYYAKYPEDMAAMHRICAYVSKNKVESYPGSGDVITATRIRQLGILLGAHGGMEMVHKHVLRFDLDLETFGEFTFASKNSFESLLPFARMPIYALLHEPCYLQGAAGNWAAEHALNDDPDYAYDAENADSKKPILLTSEMIIREMFESSGELQKMLPAADILAKDADWPMLYDEEQLAKNEVPVYAATYIRDLYVDYEYSMETASKIKGCKQYITNMLYHDALGSKTDEVMKWLWTLRNDSID
ncbi:hypothetical protein MMC25_002673 [Agyrium rufum]|nr:hypothetical protein [Agyrium rufum]